ncbi:efflux RND transporter periplasmic adaptor subunit [Dokdonella sp.]|uniref:efflux RND transporter periplasmic adaptor subunit n=1 Tax=Dokdonella sp. TaxID=2291710 RepID=UPI003C4C5D52
MSRLPAAALSLFCATFLVACTDEGAADSSPAAAGNSPRIVVEALSAVAARAGGTAAADVVPLNDSTLSAELAARVLAVRKDVGSSVKRGEVLLELDTTDYRLALGQADAQVAAARAASAQADARLKRARELHQKNYVSDDELSVAVTQAEAASAELRIRQAARAVSARQLDKATINAPYDGVVVDRMAQVGNAVVPGTPLMRLIDLATPQVEVRLQPAQASALANADDIYLELPGKRYPLRVLQVAEATDPGSRTRIARLAFVGDSAQPGLSGSLSWKSAGYEVSPSLLVQREGGHGLFTVRDGKAAWLAIEGAASGRAVMADLDGDLPVVTHGQQSLQNGDPVGTPDKPPRDRNPAKPKSESQSKPAEAP